MSTWSPTIPVGSTVNEEASGQMKMMPAGDNMRQYSQCKCVVKTQNAQGMTFCQDIKHRSNTQTRLECFGKHSQVAS